MKILLNKKLLFLCVFILISIFFIKNKNYSGNLKIKENTLIPHMGYGREVPMSSLLGTQKALASGFEIVDLDIHMSKDGKIIVFHDIDLSKRTTKEGFIYDFTKEELSKIFIEEGKFEVKEGIKSLKEHLDEVKIYKNIFVTIEIKGNYRNFDGFLKSLKNELEDASMENRSIVVVRDPLLLCKINKNGLYSGLTFVDSNYKIEYEKKSAEFEKSYWGSLPWYKSNILIKDVIMFFCEPDILAANKTVSIDYLLKLKERNYNIFIWSLNTEKDFDKFKAFNFSGIVSDMPSLVFKD